MTRSVEPVDQRTRDSLQKSVTLAIEITTQSQEASAKREAERIEQVQGKQKKYNCSKENNVMLLNQPNQKIIAFMIYI